jgi:alpha-galactosidase
MIRKSTVANWEGKLVSMKDVGYVFVNLDDCWEGSRTSGYLNYSATLFPQGFVWLCDSIRRMGLLPGIYTSAGTATCQGRPAQFSYDSSDCIGYAM